jgi:hypothetical protein
MIQGFDEMLNNSVPGERTADADYLLSPDGDVPWQYNEI